MPLTFYYLFLDQSYPDSDLQQETLSQDWCEGRLPSVTRGRSLAQWGTGLLGLQPQGRTAVAGGARVGRGGRPRLARLVVGTPPLVLPSRFGRSQLVVCLFVLSDVTSARSCSPGGDSGHGAQLCLSAAGVLALLEALHPETELPVRAHPAVTLLDCGLPAPDCDIVMSGSG